LRPTPVKIIFAQQFTPPPSALIPREAEIPSASFAGSRSNSPADLRHGYSFTDIPARWFSAVTITWFNTNLVQSQQVAERFVRSLLTKPDGRTRSSMEWAEGFHGPALLTASVTETNRETGRWVVAYHWPLVRSAYRDGGGKWWFSQWSGVEALRLESDRPEVLIKVLSNPDPAVRRRTIIRLAAAAPGNEAAGLALLPLLKDSDAEIRYVAAWALGKVGAPRREVIPALLASLRDSDAWVRATAAGALRDFPSEGQRTIPALLEAVDDPNARVRAAVCSALGDLGQNQGKPLAAQIVKVLIPKLEDNDAEVRSNAAWALGVLSAHASQAVPALTKALSDPEELVRQQARSSLRQIREAVPASH
jgi:HEAT repeats/HEAT-like repeat